MLSGQLEDTGNIPDKFKIIFTGFIKFLRTGTRTHVIAAYLYGMQVELINIYNPVLYCCWSFLIIQKVEVSMYHGPELLKIAFPVVSIPQ
jgi:hypothetical protein